MCVQVISDNIGKGRTFSYEKFSFVGEKLPEMHTNPHFMTAKDYRRGFCGWAYLLALTSTDRPVLYWCEVGAKLLHLDRVTTLGRTIKTIPSYDRPLWQWHAVCMMASTLTSSRP